MTDQTTPDELTRRIIEEIETKRDAKLDRKKREAELREQWLAMTPEEKAAYVRAGEQKERERERRKAEGKDKRKKSGARTRRKTSMSEAAKEMLRNARPIEYRTAGMMAPILISRRSRRPHHHQATPARRCATTRLRAKTRR